MAVQQRIKPEMGKFLLYQFFSRHSQVKSYLPATRRYSPATLEDFLRKHGMVYLKPSGGMMGRGILKVWRANGRIHVKKTVYAPSVFTSLQAATRHIDVLREGKAYIVQEGIHLAKVKGRPFDIRVMVQRDRPGGQWQYSGMLAKIAGANSVVTNVALSRGAVMEVEDALAQAFGWSKREIKRRVDELIRLSMTAAKHFDSYQFYRELGFDLAFDARGRLWMIEQNTGPSHPLFAKLKTRLSMYRLIQYRWGQYQAALRGRRRKSA